MMCMNIFLQSCQLSIHTCVFCVLARACMRACVRTCMLFDKKKLDSLFSYQEDGMAVRGVVVA